MFILNFLSVLLQMFIFVIFAHALMSFLFAFGIVSFQNPLAAKIWRGLSTILEPFYKPIRRFLPPMGNIDLTPLVLLIIISLMRSFLPI